MAKKMLLLFWCLLLCVTVSFSWIIFQEKNKVRHAIIDYNDNGSLVVAPEKIIMTVLMNDPETDRMVPIGSSTDSFTENSSLFEVENVVPNSIVPFKIRLHNTSNEIIRMKLSIDRLVCDEKLLSSENSRVFFSAVGASSYSAYPEIAPDNLYTSLSAAQPVEGSSENAYYLTIYETIYVPPTGDSDYVEIDCYFYFTKEMDNTFQNLNFQVLSFRAVE